MSETTKQKAAHAIVLARLHQGRGKMASSAKMSCDDAAYLYSVGDFEHALRRAKDSLGYSVGIFHPDYRQVAA